MEALIDLYKNGITFKEYIEGGKEEEQQKHLHYLKKMELTEEEKKNIAAIQEPRKLLVFSDLFCPDCRITLAVLENIAKLDSNIHYGIISREGYQDLMDKLSGDHRIPLIVDITHQRPSVIYNEYPQVVGKKMEQSSGEEKDHIKLQYRKGFYKDKMIEQLIKSKNGSDTID